MPTIQDSPIKKDVTIPYQSLLDMGKYLDDQVATAKLLQGEIDLLTGNYTVYSPQEFLHDIQSRRDIGV